MAIYFLKRFHQLIPSQTGFWTLGRELAFQAADDEEAKAIGAAHKDTDAQFGGLTVVIGPDGRCVWELEIPPIA